MNDRNKGTTRVRRMAAGLTALATALGFGAMALPAQARQPTPTQLYAMESGDRCNKGGYDSGCIVYPKSAQLPSGRIVMTFERSIGDPVGETLWVYASDDQGASWEKISEVAPPAELSDDPRYARYVSNWTNPYLYVLPEDVGDLKAGTLLLASVVSGDDLYYQAHIAEDPEWYNPVDGDRADLAIALFSSTDEGTTWSVEGVVTEGGWQGGSARAGGSVIAAENVHRQVDPVWEPYLMVYDGRLVCYYSDEDEFDAIDGDGTMHEAADNDTADDPRGQVLAHRTWSGVRGETWSAPVVDEAGTRFGNGDYGGGRPGMTTVVPTSDGRWMMTYEWWGGGDNVQYKMADSPLSFGDVQGQGITTLRNAGGVVAQGGSPVLMRRDDGSLVYNASGSGDVWVNYGGRSDGEWTRQRTNVGGGYSRNLMQIAGTGRILLFQTGFSGSDVLHADIDLGDSAGAYYRLVNRATGQVLGTGGRVQDADFTGDSPDIVQETPREDDPTQWWHLMPMDDQAGGIALLNRAGGRSVARWQNGDAVGTRLAQWADNAGANRWSVVEAEDGCVRIAIAGRQDRYIGGEADAVQVVSSATDDSTLWRLEQYVPDADALASAGESDTLATLVEEGGALSLHATDAMPDGSPLHAGKTGHVYLYSGKDLAEVTDLGTVLFDDSQRATAELPHPLEEGAYRVAVLFDDSIETWQDLAVTGETAPEPDEPGTDEPDGDRPGSGAETGDPEGQDPEAGQESDGTGAGHEVVTEPEAAADADDADGTGSPTALAATGTGILLAVVTATASLCAAISLYATGRRQADR